MRNSRDGWTGTQDLNFVKEKKKLDLVSVVGVALSVAGLFWWQWDATQKQRMQYEEAQRRAQAAATASPTPGSTPAPAGTPTPEVPKPVAATPALPEQITTVKNASGFLDLHFTNKGGGIKVVALAKHQAVEGRPIELNRAGTIPIGALWENDLVGANADYIVQTTGNSVIFERVTENGLKIVKTFSWPVQPEHKTEYMVDLDVAFTNVGAADYSNESHFLHLGSAEPIHTTDQLQYEGFDWNKNGKIIKIAPSWFDAFSLLGIQFRAARDTYLEPGENIRWAAVKNQFYTSMLFPLEGAGAKVWAKRLKAKVEATDGTHKMMDAMEGALGISAIKAKPGETIHKRFQFYFGPKEYSRLSELGNEADEILNFWPFEIVSVVLLSAMNLFNSWFGNYATAIIVLTILIKLLLWPLQSKSMRSMKEMAALTPKVQELKEKYAADPARMNQEVMALYKTYGVNPLAGCLPLLVQIPIFFGFYSMLGTAVELRNSSFLWVHDLTQPDTVGHILGFPINLLPLVMAATMLWQMNLTPKSGDQMQQRIFMFMPLIFIVFCYNYASALPLYWTVQNLFSIVQIYLTRDKPVPPLKKKTAEALPGRPGKGKGKKR